jgi:large repetitive protein
VTLVNATPSQGACSAQGSSVSCALGTIANGAAARVQIVGLIDASLAGTTLVNTATVGGAEPDPATADNTSTASSSVGAPITGGAAGEGGAASTPRAMLAIVKTTSRTTPVAPRQTVTYRIRVRTTATTAATSVTVCDHLPPGLTYVSAPGAHFRSGNACWSIARLAAHASRSFTVVARVGVDAHAGIARNTAVASARNARQVKSSASVHVVRRAVDRPRPDGVTG